MTGRNEDESEIRQRLGRDGMYSSFEQVLFRPFQAVRCLSVLSALMTCSTGHPESSRNSASCTIDSGA